MLDVINQILSKIFPKPQKVSPLVTTYKVEDITQLPLTDILMFISRTLFDNYPFPVVKYYLDFEGFLLSITPEEYLPSMKITCLKFANEEHVHRFKGIVNEIVTIYTSVMYDLVTSRFPRKEGFEFTIIYITPIADSKFSEIYFRKIKRKKPSRYAYMFSVPGQWFVNTLKELETKYFEQTGKLLNFVIVRDGELIMHNSIQDSETLINWALGYIDTAEIEFGVFKIDRQLGIFYGIYTCHLPKWKNMIKKQQGYTVIEQL